MIFHEGWMAVDEEIEISDMEDEDFDSEMSGGKSSGSILEGSRNNTMSRFAGRVLKRYGDTEKAYIRKRLLKTHGILTDIRG